MGLRSNYSSFTMVTGVTLFLLGTSLAETADKAAEPLNVGVLRPRVDPAHATNVLEIWAPGVLILNEKAVDRHALAQRLEPLPKDNQLLIKTLQYSGEDYIQSIVQIVTDARFTNVKRDEMGISHFPPPGPAAVAISVIGTGEMKVRYPNAFTGLYGEFRIALPPGTPNRTVSYPADPLPGTMETTASSKPEKEVIIDIPRDGQIKIDGKAISTEELQKTLNSEPKNTWVTIRAQPGVSYKFTEDLLNIIDTAKLTNISFSVDEEE